jgi:hypothetical protein
MSATTTASPPAGRRRSTGHVISIVAGTLAGLLAVALLAGGALSLWANGEKRDDGHLWTSTERVATPTAAVATENADLNLDGAGWLVDADAFGDVRLEATARTDAPVFVGIARTDDVSAYLDGAAHAIVTDVDTEPFGTDVDLTYRTTPGTEALEDPAEQGFWVASSDGPGTQDVQWDVEEGDWSVVVMNADGSPGIDADVRAGAELPFLTPLGWGLIGGGVVLLLAAGGLVALGVRGGAPRSDAPAPVA